MILSILKLLALGVWLGALIMLGYAVAAPIFQLSPSKTLAGTINGVILGRMNQIEWVCASVALISSAILLIVNWQSKSKTLRIAELAVIVIATVILWIYSNNVTGRMDSLRTTIGDFDHPKQTTEYVEAKKEFDTLHHTYTALVSANLLLLLSGFVLSVINSRN